MAGVLSKTGSAAVSALLKQRATAAALMSAVGKGDSKKTEEAMRSLQYQSDLLTQILLAMALGEDSLAVLGATGEPIGWIGADADKQGAWFKTLYVGGTGPDDAPFVSDEDGNVTVATLSFWAPVVDELTLADNSPASGRIAWDACSLTFAGTQYSISAGNTSSSTHKHVYWVRGASTFTTATEMPVDIDNYLIATNDGGVADIALGKIGTAKSITEDALTTTLLKGIAVQSPAYNTKNMNIANTITVLNVASGGGALLGIYVIVNTTVSGASAPVAYIDITVDGASAQSIPLYLTGPMASESWNALSVDRLGDMSAVGDYRQMSNIAFSFADSLLIQARVATAGSGGQIGMYINYGLKTAL